MAVVAAFIPDGLKLLGRPPMPLCFPSMKGRRNADWSYATPTRRHACSGGQAGRVAISAHLPVGHSRTAGLDTLHDSSHADLPPSYTLHSQLPAPALFLPFLWFNLISHALARTGTFKHHACPGPPYVGCCQEEEEAPWPLPAQ